MKVYVKKKKPPKKWVTTSYSFDMQVLNVTSYIYLEVGVDSYITQLH